MIIFLRSAFLYLFLLSCVYGNFLNSLLKLFRKTKVERNVDYERDVDTSSLIMLPIRIGFDNGVNRIGLLGKQFPVIKWTNGITVNLYTYVCVAVDDEICNWDKFLTVVLDLNPQLTYRFSKEVLKVIHTFIMCESLQGRHDICPNPCLQADLCSQSECKVTYWGLYKSDYMCICKKNQVWDDDLKKCVYFDLCFWKSGVACRAESGNKCVVNKNGSYECLPSHYDHKCRYQCEEQIVESCKKQLGYFHHLIENGHRVCNSGECVINETSRYGYSCNCPNDWIDDPSNPHPDCSLDTRTLCFRSSYSCIHGDCEWSNRVSKYICKCSRGFSGRHCDRPTAEWQEWGSWSPCHADCNEKGLQIRKRACNVENEKCRKASYHEKHHFNDKQYKSCYLDCQTNTSRLHFKWTEWSNCNASCRNNDYSGTRTRTRLCVSPQNKDCEYFPEIDIQYDSCFQSRCYEISFLKRYDKELEEKISYKWSKWSSCISSVKYNSCSQGYRYRHATCQHVNFDCEFKKIQVESCVSICNDTENYPWSLWTKWSPCENKVSFRERYCYSSGCLNQANRDQMVEREYGECESNILTVDLKYIYLKQGEKNANAFYLSSSENHQRTSYDQMNMFIKKAYGR